MKNEQPTHLDLFSGIGGFALAARWAGFRTIGFCEIDKYCQKVLAKNFMAHSDKRGLEKHGLLKSGVSNGSGTTIAGNTSKEIPIISDIFDLDGREFTGVDLITGGFPCQPFSVAGKRRGAADDRAIWPEMFRVISEARPAWVLGENVPGIIPMELDNVLSDLESIGYATRAFIIPACAVDARHRRDRLWIICRDISNSNEQRLQGGIFGRKSGNKSTLVTAGCGQEISHPKEQRLDGKESAWRTCSNGCPTEYDGSDGVRWQPEPDVGRVAHGVRSRVDRLKGLGNAIVPQVAYEIMREIRKLC